MKAKSSDFSHAIWIAITTIVVVIATIITGMMATD